jgi:hypothetical protein
MKVIIIENLYSKLRIVDGTIDYIQNISINQSQWIQQDHSMHPPTMLQPHFEGSVRSPFTLPKMGLGSPLGLPKTQDSIVGVKTLRIEVFFIPLKSS